MSFFGRVLLSLAVLTWGFSHLQLDLQNKTPSKAFIQGFLGKQGVAIDKAQFDQLYTYLTYAVMAAPLIIVFKKYGYLVTLFYIVLNIKRYVELSAKPHQTKDQIFATLNALSLDLGIVGGLLLAAGAPKKAKAIKPSK